MSEATVSDTERQGAATPYLDARREWNERYGDYIIRERNWQRLAFLCVFVAVVAVGGLAYSASQNKFVPYVIELDKLGRIQAVQPATRVSPVEPRFIKAQLADFIENLRSVAVDGWVQRQKIFAAYAMLRASDAATGMVSAHFHDASPFERAKTETVSVQIETILPLTEQSWRIEWVETRRDRTGAKLGAERWTATASTLISPPTTEAVILKNPAGLYVTELSWSKRLEDKG